MTALRSRDSRSVRNTDLYCTASVWGSRRLDRRPRRVGRKQQRMDVFAKHDKPEAWTCPECGKPHGLHEHYEERVWRHLDSCGFQTFLHSRIPRVHCPEHGVRQVRVSGAEPMARFTALSERFAVDVILEMSITGTARSSR